MTKQAGNTSADREAELRKRLADDAGSFGCPADIADLFAMLDEARAQLDEDAEQDAQIEEDAVAEHEHDLEVAYWANQVRDACDVLRPGRFGRGEPGEDPPIVTMAKAVVAERDEATKRAEAARRMLDRMAEESHTFNAILENTQRDLDEARAQLAALHAAAQRFRDAVSDDGLTCRDNGLDSAAAVEEEWEAIDRVLADLATAAAEHDAQVREQGIMEGRQEMRDTATVAIEAAKRRGKERDQFAAALAELRDHARTHGYAALAAALTADLAAQREARIRADERAKALREAEVMLRRRAARAFSAGATAVGLDGEVVRMHAGIYEAMVGEANALVKMADEAERRAR